MKARMGNDFYPTEEGLILALLERLPEIDGFQFIEPCAGDGHIVDALLATGRARSIVSNDADPARRPAGTSFHLIGDATDPAAAIWQYRPEWVVTNPPFTAAPAILPLAYEAARVGVAFLLRLTYLEPVLNRAAWLDQQRRYLAHLLVFGQPRPGFRLDGGTDSATVAWFVWTKARPAAGTEIHFVINWRQRR